MRPRFHPETEMRKGRLTNCLGQSQEKLLPWVWPAVTVCQGKNLMIASQGTHVAQVRHGAKQGLVGSWSMGPRGGTNSAKSYLLVAYLWRPKEWEQTPGIPEGGWRSLGSRKLQGRGFSMEPLRSTGNYPQEKNKQQTNKEKQQLSFSARTGKWQVN